MDMNSTDVYNYQDPVSLLAAFFIFSNGIFGVACNYLVFRSFIKYKKERNSFQLICFFRAYTNLHILITLFLAIFLPNTILGYSLYNPAIESIIISFGITLYLVNEYETILIALTRFFALYFPVIYSKFFGMKPTFTALVLLNIYQIAHIVRELIISLPIECYIYYDVVFLSWSPTFEDRCMALSSSAILYAFGGCFIGVCFFNTLNLIKMFLFYRNLYSVKSESRAKTRKNVRLFIQTCFQDSLFVLDVLFTFKLASLSTSRLWTFLSGTVIWQCLHSFDGFIMMMFNEKVTLLKKKQEVSIRVVSGTTTTL